MSGQPQPLTPEQLDALRIVVEWIDTHGFAPSLRELAHEMDRRSVGSIQHLLTELSRKGWISRADYRQRGITVLHRPSMPDFSTPEFSLARAG